MNSLISPLYQKIVALLILTTLCIIVFHFFIQPTYLIFVDKNNNIEMYESRILNYQRVIAQSDIFHKKLETIQNSPLPDLIYHGDTEVDISAQIQNDVRKLMSGGGANIENIQSISITDDDGVLRVGLRMVSQMDMEALTRILGTFRAHIKIINLDNISINTSERQNNNRTPQITVRWDIYSFGMLNQTVGGGV